MTRPAGARWFVPAVLVLLLVAAIPHGSHAAADKGPRLGPPSAAQELVEGFTARAEREGIAVLATIHRISRPGTVRSTGLASGDDVLFRFTLSDAATGLPLSGVFPGAWMTLESADRQTSPQQCRQKAAALTGTGLFNRAENDLNVYYVLTLNDDATLSVVNPLFGFGNSQLLTLVPLDSPGMDWALDAAGRKLYVSQPDAGIVSVVDTQTWTVERKNKMPGAPSRVALQPDDAVLWVSVGSRLGAPHVVAVETREQRVAASLEAAPGPHDFAFSQDSRMLFVANEQGRSVSVIDAAARRRIKDFALRTSPRSIAASDLARAVYVTEAKSGIITGIGFDELTAFAEIRIERGLEQISFAPGGRFAFVVNPQTNRVHILDAASNHVVQVADTEGSPRRVDFSAKIAYIQHAASSTVLMAPLDVTGVPGTPVHVADFTGGDFPPKMVDQPSLATGLVRAPGASAVLLANPKDKAIYYYMEGMAAPMGHFENYGRQPRAVLAVDRSLRERRPGRYETTSRLGRPGAYDLVFFLNAPRMIHCFPVTVAPAPAEPSERDAANGSAHRRQEQR